ncbi:Protein GVQW1 [Plecturocebus cupreus]
MSISEMSFHHVGQAGLELLTSGDLPASASQSARKPSPVKMKAFLSSRSRQKVTPEIPLGVLDGPAAPDG